MEEIEWPSPEEQIQTLEADVERWMFRCQRAEHDVARLEAENARLREDSEILEWLDDGHRSVRGSRVQGLLGHLKIHTTSIREYVRARRAALAPADTPKETP